MTESRRAGSPVDPNALLDLAVRAARLGGGELLRRYGHVEGLATKSSATDPVSDADRASERLITELILRERPDDGFVGEEGAFREGDSGIRWLIDPLDGTVNYLYQLDNFSVSVAALDADGPLAGAVLDPTRDRLYTAVRGAGAFHDGVRLRVNDPVPLDRALLATGFGYTPERREAQAALIAALLPRVQNIRRLGSAALDLCLLAAGRVDAYLEEGVQAWDTAAGGLIAAEAGAQVSPATPSGADSGVLAAGPALHAVLAEAVDEWSARWRARERRPQVGGSAAAARLERP
jgi:myo-inositol-1(or 4)-monophosphatase